MADPLAGAWFKVIWAHQHVDELKRHIALYFDHTPYTTPIQRHGDIAIVQAPRLYSRPHLDIQGIIGDCLGAARSSLDYIIWELASRYANRPLIPSSLGGKDDLTFPLYTDPVKWAKYDFASNRAPHFKLPASVIAAIESVQPHKVGYEPLGLLHILVNQDKHRLPLLVEGHIKHGPIGLSLGNHVATVAQSTAMSVAFHAPLDVLPVERSHEMKVDANIESKFVAFGDPTMPWEPVEVTLENIVRCAEKVVGRFTEFLV